MLNKIQIIGRIGKDIELKYAASGMAIANVSVATTEYSKGADGNKQEKTEWHRVTLFGVTAENASKYLGKGSLVYVEGRLQTRSYEKDGDKRYVTEILASVVKYLDSKGGSSNNGGTSYGNSGNSSAGKRPAAQYQAPQDTAGTGNIDDDIPF